MYIAAAERCCWLQSIKKRALSFFDLGLARYFTHCYHRQRRIHRRRRGCLNYRIFAFR